MVSRILSLMDEKGINAAQLTRTLGLANSLITEWKKGKSRPSMDVIIKISDFFDVSTDYILGRTEIRKALDPSFNLTQSEMDLVQKYRGIKDRADRAELQQLASMKAAKYIRPEPVPFAAYGGHQPAPEDIEALLKITKDDLK